MMVVRLLYTFGVKLYTLAIFIASFFNEKAKLWIDGRKQWSQRLEEAVAQWKPGAKKVWIHCASLGEFEQGRPLIEKIKENQPDIYIILSFFSPSGYEIRKDYSLADLVIYLPPDSPGNAKRFISILKPSLAIFVKYEFWYHYLSYLQKNKIPYFLVAGLLRKQQPFFQWYGAWFQSILKGFTHLFLQEKSSAKLLDQIAYKQYSVVGDPRVDRVITLSQKVKDYPEIEFFKGNKKVFIIGSSWPADEALLIPFIKNHLPEDWKVIMAPHDIKAGHILKIEEAIGSNYLKYSNLDPGKNKIKEQILIIDNIGMLSSLYQYGTLAYIGGGFGSGIHNTLEPIAFGLPVLFGPKYQKFEEANYLVANEGGFCIENEQALREIFERLLEAEQYKNSARRALAYLQQGKGATDAIFNGLMKWM